MSAEPFRPVKLLDVELTQPLEDIHAPGYGAVQALVRLHGRPLGTLDLPLTDGRCNRAAIGAAIAAQLGSTVRSRVRPEHVSDAALPSVSELLDLVAHTPAANRTSAARPSITSIICTHDNPDDLAHCLETLLAVPYPSADVVVVDNAPSTDATERLIGERFPHVGYVREPQLGLSRARNRGIAEARGDVVAFTDDDVEVDAGWLDAIAAAFAEPEVMAVTGLVVPRELETEAQLQLERYGGFGCGFEVCRFAADAGTGPLQAVAMECGTGANMAFRRALFDDIGGFDPALGAGSATGGGEELELFFRLLKRGHVLIYEPAAIVRHRHHRSAARLRGQIAGWGSGFAGYLLAGAAAHPDERRGFALQGLRWLRWQGRRLLASVHTAPGFPRRLILEEIAGAVRGARRYPEARRAAADDLPRNDSAPR